MIEALEEALRAHAQVCQQLLRIATLEHESLRSSAFSAGRHDDEKRALAQTLEQTVASLRQLRVQWQALSPQTRAAHPHIQRMIRSNQELAMKLIVLDRENEQALLRRGLLPPRLLSRDVATAAQPQAHYVSSLYRRNGA